MKRPKARYKSESEILQAIDNTINKASDLLIEAGNLDSSALKRFKVAHEYAMKGDYELAAGQKIVGEEEQDKAARKRVTATRLIEIKAKTLQERLAEFRTGSLIPLNGQPGVGDESVEAL